MPLHLVGETIDMTVLAHAVRIGRYLYRNAYLSAASAVLLGPTSDGRLYQCRLGQHARTNAGCR